MALILVFHNDQQDGKPLRDNASYDVRVLVGDGGPRSKVIATGRVEGHSRSDGWKALVLQYLNQGRE